jgi:hypothetical protein
MVDAVALNLGYLRGLLQHGSKRTHFETQTLASVLSYS